MKTKQTKQKIYPVTDMTYKCNWYIALGGTVHEAIKYYAKKHDLKEWNYVVGEDVIGHFAGHSEQRGGVIWFKDAVPGGGIVAHECVHATWWFITQHMSCKLEDNVEELFAYYVQYLVSEIGRRVW